MAILFNDDVLLLNPPKTGTNWLRAASQFVDANVSFPGDTFQNGHADLSFYGSGFRYIGCMIRNPASWIVSYWNYRSRKNHWDDRWAIDRLCGSAARGDFSLFLTLYQANCRSYITNMFRNYTHIGSMPIDFIGRQENLVSSFQCFLLKAGLPSDQKAILALQHINQSQGITLNDEVSKLVWQAEPYFDSLYSLQRIDG